jgi:hypothetical protein
MRKSLAILVCGVMLFVGVMALLAPADARRAGGARGHVIITRATEATATLRIDTPIAATPRVTTSIAT